MTSKAQALLQQALALSADERADVAAELLASLTDDSVAVSASHWEVLQKRLSDLAANPTAGRSWDSLRADLARASTGK